MSRMASPARRQAAQPSSTAADSIRINLSGTKYTVGKVTTSVRVLSTKWEWLHGYVAVSVLVTFQVDAVIDSRVEALYHVWSFILEAAFSFITVVRLVAEDLGMVPVEESSNDW